MPQVRHRKWQSGFLAPGPVYLDSSVIVGFLKSQDRLHARSVAFVGDHLIGKVPLLVSLLGLDETIWILVRDMVRRAAQNQRLDVAAELKKGPHVLQPHVPNVRKAVVHVRSWATLVDQVSASDVMDSWLDRMADVGAVHDAQHLALAEHFGAKTLATGDTDFRRVTTLPFSFNVFEL